jgi:multiple sugar transport system substrate-binding protein
MKAKLQSDPIIKTFTDALEYASEEQSPPTGSEVQDILYKQLESMWTGQQSVSDTIAQADSQIEAKLRE